VSLWHGRDPDDRGHLSIYPLYTTAPAGPAVIAISSRMRRTNTRCGSRPASRPRTTLRWADLIAELRGIPDLPVSAEACVEIDAECTPSASPPPDYDDWS
jgi:hypothetical protein